ncbi:hypothetical protein MBANPS3_008653 [Mucor bainieri]
MSMEERSNNTVIEDALQQASNQDKQADWKDVVANLANAILEEYLGNESTVGAYLGSWKGRIKHHAATNGYSLINTGNPWAEIKKALGDPSAALSTTPPSSGVPSKRGQGSTSTAPSKRARSATPSVASSVASSASEQEGPTPMRLSQAEMNKVALNYSSIPDKEKWKLSSGKVVDDEMAKVAAMTVIEHPVHSLIFDPDDVKWSNSGVFSPADLEEIRNCNRKALPEIPKAVQDLINDLDRRDGWKSGIELNAFAREQLARYDPIKDADLYWVALSALGVSHLFLKTDLLQVEGRLEAEALHLFWPFCYTLYADKSIEARLGEKASAAVSLGRNIYEEVASGTRKRRKATGSKLDILYKTGVDELGCAEVGNLSVTADDEKNYDAGKLKMPKTLRDMLVALATRNLNKAKELITVGYLLMGVDMQLVMVDFPYNLHIARVTRTSSHAFPLQISKVSTGIPPLLEMTWKGKALMKDAWEKYSRQRASVTLEKPKAPLFSFNKSKK